MTTTPIHARETISPSSLRSEEVEEIARFLADSPDGTPRAIPYLSFSDGQKHEIPGRVYDALKFIVTSLTEGNGVTVMPTHAQLTTQNAADFLQMSRPTLVKLLESGEIPFTKVGRHRRVLLADLQEYEDNMAVRRRRALADQTRQAAQDGTYFTMPDDHRTR